MNAEPFNPLLVEDIQSPNPVCVTADMSARELGCLLDVNEISGVPVLDAGDRLIGVVSKTDLLHWCAEEFLDPEESEPAETKIWDPHGHEVSEFMNPEPVTASLHEAIEVVARRMAREHVHRVVVVDEQEFVIGILTTMDMLKAFADKRPGVAAKGRVDPYAPIARISPKSGPRRRAA